MRRSPEGVEVEGVMVMKWWFVYTLMLSFVLGTYSHLLEATLRFAQVTILMFWTLSAPADVKPALSQTEIVRSLQYRPPVPFGKAIGNPRHISPVARDKVPICDSF